LGGWVFDFWPELWATPDIVGTFTGAVGEVATANVVEVAVKEPKQISTGSARMSVMLVGKMTPDRAAMLHNEFLISPT
jgi:hypothetical protein